MLRRGSGHERLFLCFCFSKSTGTISPRENDQECHQLGQQRIKTHPASSVGIQTLIRLTLPGAGHSTDPSLNSDHTTIMFVLCWLIKLSRHRHIGFKLQMSCIFSRESVPIRVIRGSAKNHPLSETKSLLRLIILCVHCALSARNKRKSG